jgi:transposase InsO family protein
MEPAKFLPYNLPAPKDWKGHEPGERDVFICADNTHGLRCRCGLTDEVEKDKVCKNDSIGPPLTDIDTNSQTSLFSSPSLSNSDQVLSCGFFGTAKVCSLQTSTEKNIILVDSGSDLIILNNRKLFLNLEDCVMTAELADGNKMSLLKKGKAVIPVMKSDGKESKLVLNAYLNEEAPVQLISLTGLTLQGYSYKATGAFGMHHLTIYDANQEAVANNVSGFYLEQPENSLTTPVTVARIQVSEKLTTLEVNKNTVLEFHHRLGHLNFRDMAALNRIYKLGIPFLRGQQYHCDACALHKSTKKVVTAKFSSSVPTTKPNQRIYCDLKGPIRPKSIRGFEYVLLIIDDYSRFITIRFLKNKAEAAGHLKDYIMSAAKPTSHLVIHTSNDDAEDLYQRSNPLPIGNIRSDNGGEFSGKDFLAFLERHGVTKTYTTAYSSNSNGIAERAIRTIFEMASTLLGYSGLPANRFWVEAVSLAAYIRNRIPTSKNKIPPLERYSGVKVTGAMLANLHSFGAKAFANIPKQSSQGREKDTFDPKAVPTVYLGPSDNRKAALLYDSLKDQLIESKDIVLHESVFPYTYLNGSSHGGKAESTSTEKAVPETTTGSQNKNSESMVDEKHSSLASQTAETSAPAGDRDVRGEIGVEKKKDESTEEIHDSSAEFSSYSSFFSEDTSQTPTTDVSYRFHKFGSCYYCDFCEWWTHTTSTMQSHIKAMHKSPETRIPYNHNHLEANESSHFFTPVTASDVQAALSNVSSSTPVSTSTTETKNTIENTVPAPTKQQQQIESTSEVKEESTHSPVSSTFNISGPSSSSSSEKKTTITVTAEPLIAPRRSERLSKKDKKNYVFIVRTETSSDISLEEALSGPERPYWVNACQKEIKSQIDNGVWDKVLRKDVDVKRIIILPSRWVLSNPMKVNENTKKLEKIYKARLVARGDRQDERSYSSQSLYAPTVASASVRLLFAISAHLGRKVEHIDFTTAFLNAPLTEEIYMTLPKGFGYEPDTLLKLKKSIYGLKQSPANWHATLKAELLRLGYKALIQDNCVFYNSKTDTMISIHVDDVQLVAPTEKEAADLKNAIKALFKIKDLGTVTSYLSFLVDYSETSIHLHQKDKIEELVSDLQLTKRKNASSPAPSNSMQANEQNPCPNTEYRSLVGRLMYLATHTRPDISVCLMTLARKCEKPTMGDYFNLLQIALYLKGTPTYGPTYRFNPDASTDPIPLCAYTDASFASLDKRYSISGGVIMVNHGPVYWQSRKQDTTPQSSTEAELVAALHLILETVHIAYMLDELKVKRTSPIPIFVDNQAVCTLTYEPSANATKSKLKYLLVKIEKIRELVADKTIKLEWIQGKSNPADVLTKPLSGTYFQQLSNSLLGQSSLP